MSISINLNIATLASNSSSNEVTEFIRANIAKPFLEASQGDIDLRVSISSVSPKGYEGPIQSDQLHSVLEQVTGWQRKRSKVHNIGLLIADEYAPRPDFFGYMFDEDFSPGFSNPWATTPREGCAIFLGAIARKRQDSDLLSESLYTAIHEVGHIFNLQHSSSPSYMAQSASRTQPFDLKKTSFGSLEKLMLSQCSSSSYVWPGGCKFGNLGPFSSQTSNTSASNSADIQLKISLTRSEFFFFEPIELDISILTESEVGISVPDMIDPGYQEFSIWVEDPIGERRKYNSPRHYCPTRKRVSIAKNKPFERDISIFGESGGYFFRRAGRHRIWATYRYGTNIVVASNTLEIDLLPITRSSSFNQASQSIFTDTDIGKFLYHRRLSKNRQRKIENLTSVLEAFPNHPSTAMAHYSIGRAYAAALKQAHTKEAGNFTSVAKRSLEKALSNKSLGKHRQNHAERDLHELFEAK